MRFALLDNVRCSCGNEGLHLDQAITVPADPPLSEDPDCQRFCGWKQRPLPSPEVTATDCHECRRQRIIEGILTCTCGSRWPVVDGIPSFSTSRVREKGARRFRVIETNPRTDPRWEPFVLTHPQGSPFHHPGWLRALEEEYGQTRMHLAAEDGDGRLLAILPMFYTRGLPFNIGANVTMRRLCSLPRTPSAGILSVSPEATAAVLESAMECCHRSSGVQLQIKTEAPGLEQLAPRLIATSWRPTFVTTLPDRPEAISFGNSAARHRLKWAVNKAVKMGLRVREAETEAELRAWYPLYLEVMRHNAVLPRPYRFFVALWRLFRKNGIMRLLLAERDAPGGPELMAGSIILKFGSSACYAFTGGRRRDFSYHPNDLIQWQAIHDACRAGARHYDFGEVAEEHRSLQNFKSKWGAEPVPQFRYYWPATPGRTCTAHSSTNRLWQGATAVWRQVPLPATARCGDWLYSFL